MFIRYGSSMLPLKTIDLRENDFIERDYRTKKKLKGAVALC